MNTPKTAALWELLREMGWSEDQRPVSFIMQSHEELEKELSDLEAGFDADGRSAAEACCEEFKNEQAERIKELEKQLVAAKEQISSRNKRLADMKEELEQARQDAKQSDLDAIRALGERNDAREELAEVSKDFRCLAELLDGHDATECRANLVRLKESLAAETARADEQFALAMELAAKLETERALADRLGSWMQEHRKVWQWHKADPSCNCEDCEFLVPFDEALAAYKAARAQTKP